MRAANQVAEKLQNQDRDLALGLCFAVDRFVADPTPDRLQEISDVIRGGLQHTAAEVARLDRIVDRRRVKFRRLKDRAPRLTQHMAAHYDAIAARRDRLEHRRRMLLQVGDGLAWHLMGRNQRLVTSLYAKGTHGLSEGIGLGGVLLVQDALHKSGRYFAFENDLARCASTDDLMVVPVGRIGVEPLLLELKTKGEFREGAELGIGIATAHSNAPEHKAMYEDVSRILESEPWKERTSNPRAERQFADLEARTKRAFERNRSGAQQLRRPDTPHWRTMSNVIDRALAEGHSFDIAETGVLKWAVRARPGDDVEQSLKRVQHLMYETAGVSEENPHRISSNVDLALTDALARFVTPVVLWDLPIPQRAALLAGDVAVGNLRQAELLQRKLSARGITVTAVPGGFKLQRGDSDAVIDQLEWYHIEVSMALTGVSTEDVAATIAEGLVPHVAVDEATNAEQAASPENHG